MLTSLKHCPYVQLTCAFCPLSFPTPNMPHLLTCHLKYFGFVDMGICSLLFVSIIFDNREGLEIRMEYSVSVIAFDCLPTQKCFPVSLLFGCMM